MRGIMFNNTRILVTGASGFIGTNLMRRLVGLGARVRGVLHTKSAQINDHGIEFIKGDLRNASFCDEIMENIDIVFMCAANTSGAFVINETPLAHVTPNIIMNSLCLESAYKACVTKFVFISSSTVYPNDNISMQENDMKYEFFEKYYCVGWMKAFSEVLCEMYSRKIRKPMHTVIVRPSNIYGEFDDFEWETSHVLPSLIRKCVSRHDPITVWGNGDDIKDFIYIDDFIDGLLLAARTVSEFDIFNVSTEQPVSIKGALSTILEVDGYNDVNIEYDTSKPTMIPARYVNSRKIRKLGFSPKTTFSEGIEKTIKWYRCNL